MKTSMIWANFSVKDVQRTHRFYTQLGFQANNTNDFPKLASFRFGDNNLVIHFFEQGSQIDEYLPAGAGGGEVIFTMAANTEAEVQEWAERVTVAGGQLLKAPGRDNTNHYGFTFADPDGHKFNVLLLEPGM